MIEMPGVKQQWHNKNGFSSTTARTSWKLSVAGNGQGSKLPLQLNYSRGLRPSCDRARGEQGRPPASIGPPHPILLLRIMLLLVRHPVWLEETLLPTAEVAWTESWRETSRLYHLNNPPLMPICPWDHWRWGTGGNHIMRNLYKDRLAFIPCSILRLNVNRKQQELQMRPPPGETTLLHLINLLYRDKRNRTQRVSRNKLHPRRQNHYPQ